MVRYIRRVFTQVHEWLWFRAVQLSWASRARWPEWKSSERSSQWFWICVDIWRQRWGLDACWWCPLGVSAILINVTSVSFVILFSFFHFLVMHICDFKCFDKNPRLFLNVMWLVLLNCMVSVINFESSWLNWLKSCITIIYSGVNTKVKRWLILIPHNSDSKLIWFDCPSQFEN